MTDAPGREAVLWPLSRKASTTVEMAERPVDLNGKTVCELWDVIFRGEMIYPLIREQLKARYPGVKIVDYTHFGNFHGPKAKEILEDLPRKLKEQGADAVIAGIGA